mgnify:CR=1 FL=1
MVAAWEATPPVWVHPIDVGGAVPYGRQCTTFLHESLNSQARCDFNRGGVEHDLPNKVWISRIASTVVDYIKRLPQQPTSTRTIADAMEAAAGIAFTAMAMNKNLPDTQQFLWKDIDQWVAWRNVWMELQKLGLGPELPYHYTPVALDHHKMEDILLQHSINWGQVLHEAQPHIADLSMDISAQAFFAAQILTSLRGEILQFVTYIDRLIESGQLKWSYWLC